MRHPNLADRADSCLVVVDMQEPFLRTMFDRDAVVDGVQTLVGAAQILDLPILITVQNPDRMGDTVPEITEVLPPVEAISKMSFSCCGDESFVETLEQLGKKTVILCGIETHICISQTAHDLLVMGYKVQVPEDAVCSRIERNWRAGLEKMRQSGVIITSTEAVIFELLGCAGSGEFRQVLKLVK